MTVRAIEKQIYALHDSPYWPRESEHGSFLVKVNQTTWACAVALRGLLAVRLTGIQAAETRLQRRVSSTTAVRERIVAEPDLTQMKLRPLLEWCAAAKELACGRCAGRGHLACGGCKGRGYVTATCGECDDLHEHQCPECEGARVARCAACEEAGGDVGAEVLGVRFSRLWLYALLESRKDVRVGVGALGGRLYVQGRSWRAVLDGGYVAPGLEGVDAPAAVDARQLGLPFGGR
jgi:hypothetical protein